MAEGLFEKLAQEQGSDEYRVISCGIGAINGQPPSQYSVISCNEEGVDISDIRSQPMTEEIAFGADYIFCMTSSHLKAVKMLFPFASEKVFLVKEFIPDLEPFEKDIVDPIGMPLDIYIDCCKEIKGALPSVLQFIEETQKQKPMEQELQRKLRVAIGSDHAGFELKESLKGLLKAKNVELEDFGTHSKDSVDYPDFAHQVAESVSNENFDYGILVCKTGIGMSITANKIPGVRAALVHDDTTARLSRQHNNSNVVCLSADETSADRAAEIVDVWLNTTFEGGRHERRVSKIEETSLRLSHVDPQIARLIEEERERQQDNIELIASENFTSPAVMEAQGSVLTNKYAEGYPKKRWYGGCEFVDGVEQLAIDRAKKLFGAEHANVQPHSGSGANMAVYFAFLQPGDKILTMDLAHGGHLTHGFKTNFSGRFYEVVHYGVRKDNELLDYDSLEQLAREHKPKLVTVGASAYPRVIDFERVAQIARDNGALLMVDMAHIAGLVAAGVHPSPVPYADFVTTTTHKTLRGPRAGLILCREQFAKEINAQVFPGIQGGPLEHVIAAKAVCFQEAMQPSFKAYQEQVVKNSRTLAERMKGHGYRIVSGGTDNHLCLVDVSVKGLTGKDSSLILDQAGITVNKNAIPFDTKSPFVASGIRLGSPACTTRGFKEEEFKLVGDLIAEALAAGNAEASGLRTIREKVRALTARFPLPY